MYGTASIECRRQEWKYLDRVQCGEREAELGAAINYGPGKYSLPRDGH